MPSLDFYPRSPRGERHDAWSKIHKQGLISIHAPREGSDIRLVGSAMSAMV